VASVYGAACADRANGDAETLPATWRALRELRGDRASQTQTEGHDTVRPCPECVIATDLRARLAAPSVTDATEEKK
jgi:hypothetical protein